MKKPKLDSLLDKQNLQFSALYKKFNPTHYKSCYASLAGRVLTPTVSKKKHGVLFSGSLEPLKKLTPLMGTDDRKNGLFVTKQRCTSVNGWCDSANATAFDTFVVEFDRCCLLDEQLALLDKSGMPRSGLVFSGNKSIHCLIVLAKPVIESRFREIIAALAGVFPQADRAVLKDLNGFFRFPSIEKGCFQPLIEWSGPVKNKVFEDWLAKHASEDATDLRDSECGEKGEDSDGLERRILTKIRELINEIRSTG